MNKNRQRDEYLEKLWYMKERNTDAMDALKDSMGSNFDPEVIDRLLSDDLVQINESENKIVLAEKGDNCAKGLIRAHRLAERLIYDVLGADFESGACEFEHTVSPELLDSICTLLGHPKACPHGMPIPQGQCCISSSRSAQSCVVPLSELEVGQSAKVAYVDCKSDRQLHRIESLRIRPGVVVTLHQKYPAYVIECEDSNIAMDEQIVSNICVWRKPRQLPAADHQAVASNDKPIKHWNRLRNKKQRN